MAGSKTSKPLKGLNKSIPVSNPPRRPRSKSPAGLPSSKTSNSPPAVLKSRKLAVSSTAAVALKRPSRVSLPSTKIPISDLVMHKHPIQTLGLFLQETKVFVDFALGELKRHPAVRVAVAVAVIGYLAVHVSGNARTMELAGMFVMWWVGLGVLSSIGLGSGLHTGMLFLFPHIFRVVQAAEICKGMNFDSFGDMWWSTHHLMTCKEPKDDAPLSFFRIALRVWIPAVLWGVGTAMGEIPPYAMSRAAYLAGNSLDADLAEELQVDDSPIGKMKGMMIRFVQQWGFWGVFLMSAWPNAAFDLVGIVCGQIGVSFWTFILATICGKAVVKVTGQVVFFVSIFRHTEEVIEFCVSAIDNVKGVLPMFMTKQLPSHGEIKLKLEAISKQLATGKGPENSEAGWIAWTMEKIILLVILSFAVSCVNQFAQKRQKDLNKASSASNTSNAKSHVKKSR